MGKLVLYLADGTLLHVPLDKERITLGRRADNDVCLPYPAVSGEHAAVVTILADSFLEDLGSTNGTLVNGKAIAKHFLNDRDQIDIGRQRLTYVADDDARVDPLPPDIVRNQLRGLSDRIDAVRGGPQVPLPSINTGRAPIVNAGILMGDEFEQEMIAPARDVSPAAPAVSTPLQPEAPERAGRPSGDVVPEPQRGTGGARLAPEAAPRVPTTPRGPFTGEAPARMGDPAASAPDLSLTQRMVIPVAPPAAPPAVVVPDASAPSRPPSVRVLSGPSTGRVVPFPNAQLSVGRVGIQVAIVRKTADGFALVPVEGAQPPKINGAPVGAEGSPLHPGDTFEVAGVRLELSSGS
jgi:FHA domain